MKTSRQRLQKFLAAAGVASRRQAEKLILAGRVKVNGQVVTELGTSVDPTQDTVEVDGRQVAPEPHIYLLLHKPAGYVTTVRDPHGRPTVMDLVKGIKQRIFPVGRLDYATEGFLLLTNDGELAWALTHPRHHVPKFYLAWVEGVPDTKDLERFRRGILLEDGLTAPARVRLVSINHHQALLFITLFEGRNRQVRRMCQAIGHPVRRLIRIGEGPLRLGKLPRGAYRFLTPQEVTKLRRAAGLDAPPSEEIK